MALLADRVRETTTTAGTGTLTLDGAPSGFRTFTTAFGNGVSVYYVIAGPSEWEIGIGTTGAGTLSRDTVLVSSAGGTTKVTFAAGTKDVFCSYVAPRAVTTEDAATLTNKTIDSITNLVGADHIHYKIKANATIAKGQTLKVVGYNVGQLAIEVEPVSSASDVAVGIAYQALSTGDFGAAINTGLLTGTKTDYAGWALGDILYPDPSTGGLTKTKPSSGTYQACAYVMRVNSNNGVLLCEFTEPEPVAASANTANTVVARDGSGNFSAGTITAALSGNASTASALTPGATINGVTFTGASNITVAAAAGTLTGNTLASGVTASSLTSVGTLTSLTVTSASAAAPFAVNSNNANGVYYDLSNAQNSSSFRIAAYGTVAFGVSAFISRASMESSAPNGLVISAYTGGTSGGAIEFMTGARVNRWSIGASTGHLLAATDNTYDIGASGATRPRDLYLGGNMVGGGWMRAGAASAGAASTTTIGNGTATTVGASGAASALPANPLGYIVAHVGTTQVKIPYYTA